MKKKLDLDALEVESFVTNSIGPSANGTVFGYDESDGMTRCYGQTCDFYCWEETNANCGTGDGFCDSTGCNSMQTACLDCYTNANTCTMVETCNPDTVTNTCVDTRCY